MKSSAHIDYGDLVKQLHDIDTKHPTTTVGFRVTDEVVRDLRMIAALNNTTVSHILRVAVIEYFRGLANERQVAA